MVRAFAVLQEQREEGGPPVVTRNNWNQLIQLVQPNLSSARRQLVWSVCDDKNQGFLGEQNFCSMFLERMKAMINPLFPETVHLRTHHYQQNSPGLKPGSYRGV